MTDSIVFLIWTKMMFYIHKGSVLNSQKSFQIFKLKTILSKCAERNCIWDSLKYSNEKVPNCYFPENYPSYNLVDQGSNES